MRIESTTITVADYCAAMKRGELRVNSEYQRSDKVWPPAARSFLIETIMLGYPIPKLSLYQVTDVKSRRTYKDIVDGQQRSKAIYDFYENGLELSSNCEVIEVAGKSYKEIDREYQHRFLNYGLQADLFVSATDEEIREIFRRINSYTVPLNPEERRHAEHQGVFKWFIYRLSKKYDQAFLEMGTFTQKQLVRMADTKLLTEIVHALLNGISTTKEAQLKRLYEEKDDKFDEQDEMQRRIEGALDVLLDLKEVHDGPLMKPYLCYSLILAITHRQKPVKALNGTFSATGKWTLKRDIVTSNLSLLASAIEEDSARGKFKTFVLASSERTNVAEQRKTRFKWLCRALGPELI